MRTPLVELLLPLLALGWASIAGATVLNPGECLVAPDPDDIPRIFNGGPQVRELDYNDLRCGSERVDRCDDLGGTIEIQEGAGCKSQQKLVLDGLAVKTPKLQRLSLRGQLAVAEHGRLVALGPDTTVGQLLRLAQDGKLVNRLDVLRDLKRGIGLPRNRAIAPEPLIGCDCTCVVWSMTDPQVTNAQKGDVGLVPVSDGGGEEIVRTIMNTLGQNHRHAVIFIDNQTIRHNTSYDEIDANDLETNTRLKPSVLRNAQPGFITESVEAALASERLGWSGLLLKVHDDVLSRAVAEDAVDIAVAAQGYYKIADYSELDGWTLPYHGPNTAAYDTDNLRGTMCSGLVYHSFFDAGFAGFTSTFYPAGIRNDLAKVLYDSVKAEVKSSLSWTQQIGSFLITGTAKHIANQVTNCFAGLGCDDNNNTWKKGVGTGQSVSPDNLLPTAFDLSGTGSAPWDGGTIRPGDHVVNPNGASVTPFTVVEPMNVLGTSWDETVLTDW